MSVKERILALRLWKKQEADPNFVRKIGVNVQIAEKNKEQIL